MGKQTMQTSIIHWARICTDAFEHTLYKVQGTKQVLIQHNVRWQGLRYMSKYGAQADMGGAEGLPSAPDLINCPEEYCPGWY